MAFKDFRRKIFKELRKAGYTVRKLEERTENGTEKDLLSIKDKMTKVRSDISEDNLYTLYEAAVFSEDELMEILLPMLSNGFGTKYQQEEIDWLSEWNDIKKFVRARLVNIEQDENIFYSRPHTMFCDIGVVFSLEFHTRDDIIVGLKVSYELMKSWEKDEKALLVQAVENMSNEKIHITDVQGRNVSSKTDTLKNEKEEKIKVYFLTNEQKRHGTSFILSNDVRRQLLDYFQEKVYLFPLGIHRWCIIRENDEEKSEYLYMLAGALNIIDVEEKEFLTANVYCLNMDGSVDLVQNLNGARSWTPGWTADE